MVNLQISKSGKEFKEVGRKEDSQSSASSNHLSSPDGYCPQEVPHFQLSHQNVGHLILIPIIYKSKAKENQLDKDILPASLIKSSLINFKNNS
jgi:hypothetical protein